MKILLTRSAERQLDKLPDPLAKPIAAAVKNLATNPFPTQSKRLSGKPYFRLRHGDYRVLYAVDQKAKTIIISRIAHRREVYRNL